MKKYVTISLFISFTITTAVLATGLIIFENGRSATASTPGSNNSFVNGSVNQSGKITGVSANTASLNLSKVELAKHNSRSSCWLLISGKIYDVTSYIQSHPGGEAEILKTCGTDATVIYDNRDNTGSHSSSARSMLADYYIGDLNQTVQMSDGSPTAPTIVNPSVATIPPTSRRDDDDD